MDAHTNANTTDGNPVRIVGIAGSLRQGSFNRLVLDAAARQLPDHVEMTIWEGLEHVPPFNEDAEIGPVPAAVAEIRRLIDTADGLMIVTPEYNGAMPGQLKNALDWASRPRGQAELEGKLVATASAAASPHGGAWAQEGLRKVLGIIGAEVTDTQLVVGHVWQQFDDSSDLVDPALHPRLVDLLAELVTRARTDGSVDGEPVEQEAGELVRTPEVHPVVGAVDPAHR